MARNNLFPAISKLAQAKYLGVSRQSLYYKPKRPAKDEVLREKILDVLSKHPAYGHRRIALALKKNKKSILRVMRLFHIYPVIVRKSRKYSKSKEIIHLQTPNRLKEVEANEANIIWVGDITCLWFHRRHVYLATVMDYFTREIIAWQIGLHHTGRLVTEVLIEAKRKRKKTPKVFHTDQGSEYTSHLCLNWLVKNKILASNSPKGKPWTNGRQESFFSNFKLEFGKPSKYTTLEKLIEGLGKYIHYYNSERIHSALKMSPKVFYKKTKKKKK